MKINPEWTDSNLRTQIDDRRLRIARLAQLEADCKTHLSRVENSARDYSAHILHVATTGSTPFSLAEVINAYVTRTDERAGWRECLAAIPAVVARYRAELAELESALAKTSGAVAH